MTLIVNRETEFGNPLIFYSVLGYIEPEAIQFDNVFNDEPVITNFMHLVNTLII